MFGQLQYFHISFVFKTVATFSDGKLYRLKQQQQQPPPNNNYNNNNNNNNNNKKVIIKDYHNDGGI